MSRLIVFDQVSLDGFFTDAKGDMSWAHRDKQDAEWSAWVEENAKSGGTLVFGRITYEMMASYWPTPAARAQNPVVAEGMNSVPKLVFSRTLKAASWSNTRLVKEGPAAELRKLKKESSRDLVILGSGTLVAQLTQERLIDEYRIVVYPIVLGSGRTLFEGVKERQDLKLARTRAFRNGNVVLWYERAA